MSDKKSNVISLHGHKVATTTGSEAETLRQSQKEFCEQAVRSILYALDCKDHYTYGHSMRVAYYSLTLGKELGLDAEQ